ncbi:MAG: hypothetical protein PVF87_10890 [Acidimicrobiia bacterium]|jgi:hypothetical protein
MRVAVRYVVAIGGGVVLGYVFTELRPLAIFGEGSTNSELGVASILAVASLFPGLFVGGVILKSWRGAGLVALVTGAVTSAVYLLDLIERPPPEPLVWPTFVVPAVAVLTAGILDLLRTIRGRSAAV